MYRVPTPQLHQPYPSDAERIAFRAIMVVMGFVNLVFNDLSKTRILWSIDWLLSLRYTKGEKTTTKAKYMILKLKTFSVNVLCVISSLVIVSR